MARAIQITEPMKSNDTRGRRHGGGGRRPYNRNRRDERGERGERSQERGVRPEPEAKPAKLSFWGKILAFFTGKKSAQTSSKHRDSRAPRSRDAAAPRAERRAAPPETVPVNTPKLYVGNLSYDATESDLVELFNGVGKVQNTEIVTHRGTERSRGYGFVTMLTVDEALRAVQELHDKPFMGRKLVVTGSKSEGPRT
jgi:hypothetical protein